MAKEPKEPFVSSGDRPPAEIDLDTPVAQLRIRDLRSILGGLIGPLKVPHPKFEAKTELKEFFDKPPLEKAPDILFRQEPDPTGLGRLIETTTALVEKVDRLSDQVAELEKKIKG